MKIQNISNMVSYQYRDYRIHLNNTLSKIKKKTIKTYWCRANNFGDWLTPLILEHYGFTPIFSSAYDAEVILVGSIMEHIPTLFKGKIIGTGFINQNNLYFPNAEILAVRGKLSLNQIDCNYSHKILLGDPGLLIGDIIRESHLTKKRFILGIVPHVSDVNHAFISDNRTRGIKIIDPRQSPISVAKEIQKCNYILSSSLHGLIFSDALRIPNRRIILTGRLLGGNFKFDDYYSSISFWEEPLLYQEIKDLKVDVLISKTTLKDTPFLDQIISHLKQLFINLKNEYELSISKCNSDTL